MATDAVDTPVVEKAQEEVAEDESSPKEDGEGSKPAEQSVEEGYDASLLVFVKGKAKRPARPDDAERNMQVQKLQEQIDKASARITEIKAILDARGSSRGVVNPEVQACRDKIQQLRAEFDTVLVGPLRPTAACCRSWGCPGQAAGPGNSFWGRPVPNSSNGSLQALRLEKARPANQPTAAVASHTQRVLCWLC